MVEDPSPPGASQLQPVLPHAHNVDLLDQNIIDSASPVPVPWSSSQPEPHDSDFHSLDSAFGIALSPLDQDYAVSEAGEDDFSALVGRNSRMRKELEAQTEEAMSRLLRGHAGNESDWMSPATTRPLETGADDGALGLVPGGHAGRASGAQALAQIWNKHRCISDESARARDAASTASLDKQLRSQGEEVADIYNTSLSIAARSYEIVGHLQARATALSRASQSMNPTLTASHASGKGHASRSVGEQSSFFTDATVSTQQDRFASSSALNVIPR